jgi:hypothetical protein
MSDSLIPTSIAFFKFVYDFDNYVQNFHKENRYFEKSFDKRKHIIVGLIIGV